MAVRRSARRASAAQRFVAGPWRGVVTTTDPFDDTADMLVDAINLYIPDPTSKVGAYARPGFALLTAAPLTTGTFRGQGVFTFLHLDGSAPTNFLVMKGKLYRADVTFSTFTDVTPSGITIDPSVTTRVYGVMFGTTCIVTDGVNRPWILTDATATPATGAYIDFDGSSTAWSAFGKPTVYGGSLFFILNTLNSVGMRSTIAWSNPADPTTGYQQPNYDFAWTIFASGIAPITAIQGTNTALFYGTENTIGEIVGPVGPNLQTSATTAAISVNVGMALPATVVLFGQTIFFCDGLGRPYMLPIGGAPVPIWLSMRGIVDASSVGYPAITARVATATFEPSFNLYLVAMYSCLPSSNGPATEMFAFDARTGIYMGRWVVGVGVQVETLGVWLDLNLAGTLIVLGSLAAPTSSSLAASGYIWGMNGNSSQGDYLLTEGGSFLTTEAGVLLATEGNVANWLDNGAAPTISATTTRLGYSTNELLTVDRAAVIVGNQSPVTISMASAATATTVEATPTPLAARDDEYRAIAGADMMGRGITVTVSPTTATSQWSIQQVTVDATASAAAPDEY